MKNTTRLRFAIIAILAAAWTVGACIVADCMLRDTWTYSCTTDDECETEDRIREIAERSID